MVYEDKFLTVEFPETGLIPGYMIVSIKGDIYSLADLTKTAQVHLIDVMAKLHKLIKEIIQPERIYTLSIGEIQPRLHFHLFPRTKALLDKYIASTDAAGDINGMQLFDWVRNQYKDVAFGGYEKVNAELAERLRDRALSIPL